MAKKILVKKISVTGKGDIKDVRIELPKGTRLLTGVHITSNVVSGMHAPASPYTPPPPVLQGGMVTVTNFQEVDWLNVIGNSIEYVYYTGVEAGNPSGNKNIKLMIHKKNTTQIFIQLYTYDVDDDVVEIKTYI